MRKVIGVLIGTFILGIILIYSVLFTQLGNNILKPAVQSKINKLLHTHLNLETFTLRPSTFKIKLATKYNSSIVITGKYGILSKFINATYNIKVSRTEKNLVLSGRNIKGPFFIKGKIEGYIGKKLTVSGETNIGNGKTTYHVNFIENHLQFIRINSSSIKLSTLLHSIGYKKWAYAIVNTEANLHLNKQLKGSLKIILTNGNLNKNLIKEETQVNIPETRFNAKAYLNLKGNSADFNTSLNSSVVNIITKGTFNNSNKTISSMYEINIDKLSLLKPIINVLLKGQLKTTGKISGKTDNLKIKGNAILNRSQIDYNLSLRNNYPQNITLLIKNGYVQDIIHLLGKPIYATGDVRGKIQLSTINIKNLNGAINLHIKKGEINKYIIKKEFNINLPNTHFSVYLNSDIKHLQANYSLKLLSNIVNLYITKGALKLPNLSLSGNYKLYLGNLDNLYPILKRHLRGAATIYGKFEKNKNFLITATSSMFGGVIKAKLINDTLTATAKNVSVVKITDTFLYPHIFDSRGNVSLTYNIKTKKGMITSLFKNGHILPTTFTLLLRQLTGFNITKEIYKITTTKSSINKGVILTDLNMESKNTQITSHKALINLNKNLINAKLKVKIRKNIIYVTLKDNLSHPKIKINAKELIRKKIESEIKNLLFKGLK